MEEKTKSILWWPKGNKLIFIESEASPEFWDKHWKNDDWRAAVTRSRHSRLWSEIIKKYLPNKECRILEGGCGSGNLVDAMTFWGYDAIGVDNASRTIANIKDVAPDLNIQLGDVRRLTFADNYFDGYLSLGVIEHFWDGFDEILSEMHRVLRIGGYAFVTYPCVSPLDRIKVFFGGYPKFDDTKSPKDFYQFALNLRETRKLFEAKGFACMATRRLAGLMGIERVIPDFARINSRLSKLSTKSRLLRLSVGVITTVLAPFSGHIALMVMKKK